MIIVNALCSCVLPGKTFIHKPSGASGLASLFDRVHLIKQVKNQAVFRDVTHRGAVMLVMDIAFFVDQQQGRNPAKFKKVPLLSIKISDLMPGVGQACEG